MNTQDICDNIGKASEKTAQSWCIVEINMAKYTAESNPYLKGLEKLPQWSISLKEIVRNSNMYVAET